jgi:TPR repeat protein
MFAMKTDLVANKIEVDDLLFAKRFGVQIGEDYSHAIEVMTVFPEYALLKYRQVFEQLCAKLCSQYQIQIEHFDTLHLQIKELGYQGGIDERLVKLFHELRKLTNSAVHKSSLMNDDLGFSQDSEFQQQSSQADANRKSQLLKDAELGRQLLLEVMTACGKEFRCLAKNEILVQAKLESLELNTLILKALNSNRAHDKFMGGKAIEKMLTDQQGESESFIESDVETSHRKSQLKIALSLYKAAIDIDAELDALPTSVWAESNKAVQLRFSRSRIEYLFHFADIAINEDLDLGVEEHGLAALQIAANKQFVPAMALLGAKLYNEDQFSQAYELLETAAKSNSIIALRFLYHYYSDGKACDKDPDLAKHHIEKACELGCTQSMIDISTDYFNGNTFFKDIDKAEKWMNLAREKGDVRAKFAYEAFFSNKLQEITKAFTDEMLSSLDKACQEMKQQPISIGQKVGVNEPCPCGSGKKYKKCCRTGATTYVELF